MTKEEAEEIVKDVSREYYVDVDPYMGDQKVGLDGRFTATELEAILILTRAAFQPEEKQP